MSKVRDHSKHRHLLRLFCLFIAVAAFSASAIVFALRGKPFFLIFGIVSFGAVFVVVCMLLLLYVLLQSIYLRRHHPGLWKKSFFSTSLGERIEASRKIRSLQIPFLGQVSRTCNNVASKIVLIWLVIYLLVSGIVVIMGIVRT